MDTSQSTCMQLQKEIQFEPFGISLSLIQSSRGKKDGMNCNSVPEKRQIYHGVLVKIPKELKFK